MNSKNIKLFVPSIKEGTIIIQENKVIQNFTYKFAEHKLDTFNKVVRDSLIELGWTPPKKE